MAAGDFAATTHCAIGRDDPVLVRCTASRTIGSRWKRGTRCRGAGGGVEGRAGGGVGGARVAREEDEIIGRR